MVEIRRGMDDASGSDRLPWLEPVEDEDYARGGGDPGNYGGVIVTVIAVLIAFTMITAAVVWYRHHRAASADIGGVIHAPEGPYKVKPPETGGLKTDQVGEVASGTGAGEDIDGALDLNAVPEQPMIQRKAAPAAQPQQQQQQPAAAQAQPSVPAPALPQPAKTPPPAPVAAIPAPPPPAPVAPKPDAPIAPPPVGGGSIQLGAFSTEAKAKSAWKMLSGRFAYLHDANMAIEPVKSGDNTLYRLRASGGAEPASRLCARLKIAGETCAVVGN